MTALCQLCNRESSLYVRTKDFNRRITKDSFEYYRCPSCGLIFLSPIPGDVGKYYPEDYYSVPVSAGRLAAAAELERYKIEIVKKFVSQGRLLEIGPAYGSFVYLAKEAGFETEAIEMDSNCCRFLRDVVGVRAVNSNDPAGALREVKSYNVIALWHVIEHLPDPWSTIESIAAKILPGGILVIAAPNPDALQFHILGRFWPHVDAPRHLTLIPLSLLESRVSGLGLRKVWATTADKGALGWNTFGWEFFFANGARSRYARRGLRIAGRIISMIMGPLERTKNRGSAYTVVFRKEREGEK